MSARTSPWVDLTVGEKLNFSNTILCRILNHTALKSDLLHRHHVRLNEADVAGALVQIQVALTGMMQSARQRV
jgi:hypothetical protein